jgi:hypothetical protein
MHEIGFGWFEPAFAALLAVLGGLLRFLRPSARFGIGLPFVDSDVDLRRRSRNRVGEMLILWALWVVVQMLTGAPATWMSTVWAPLIIVAAVAYSYPARLYARRYLIPSETPESADGERPYPLRGGWAVVLLREIVPLAAVLVPILLVRDNYQRLPDRVPVAWALNGGPLVWASRSEAVALLRHQTMLVYLLLAGLEGVYLVIRWARGRRGDIAQRMLTRRHWFFFLFRVGWVALFAGINLGFVYHALAGRSPYPFLIPGLFALSALGILIAMQIKRIRRSSRAGS